MRLYPTVVLAQSPLATLFHQKKYHPLTLDEAVSLCARLYCIFKHNRIRVIRMGLQATDELQRPGAVIAGPFHPAFGHLVMSRICLETVLATVGNQPLHKLAAPPTLISALRGQRNANLARFKSLAGNFTGDIEQNTSLAQDQLEINGKPVSLCAGKPPVTL